MGGDIHYVDMPDGGDELITLRSEPIIQSMAGVNSDFDFNDDVTRESAKEVEMAKKQAAINEQMRQQEKENAK